MLAVASRSRSVASSCPHPRFSLIPEQWLTPIRARVQTTTTHKLACATRSRSFQLSRNIISTPHNSRTQITTLLPRAVVLAPLTSISTSARKSSTASTANTNADTDTLTSTTSLTPPPPQPASTPTPTTSSMAPTAPLATIPIAAYKSKTHTAPEGSITITQPHNKIYVLTFQHGPDNRLTPPLIQSLRLALDILLTTLPPGIVITTSSIPKFYSNGLDYAGAISDPSFMGSQLFPLWRQLLTFPWPTVALINGHGFAGGLMTAMAHDYRIMNPHKGYLCLNELDFNAPLSPAMATLFKNKLSMATFRTLVLEGKRFGALAALEAGVVDAVGGLDEAVKVLREWGVEGKLRDVGVGSYGLIKEELYRETIADLDRELGAEQAWAADKKKGRDAALQEGKQRVEAWKKSGGKLADVKAKL